jgi:hypothetical protein
VFAYGCLDTDKVGVQLYPYILSQLSPIFSFQTSSFNMHKAKENTMRIAMFRELKVLTCYTIEASFFGPDFGVYRG